MTKSRGLKHIQKNRKYPKFHFASKKFFNEKTLSNKLSFWRNQMFEWIASQFSKIMFHNVPYQGLHWDSSLFTCELIKNDEPRFSAKNQNKEWI